jgi:hypothetical protein
MKQTLLLAFLLSLFAPIAMCQCRDTSYGAGVVCVGSAGAGSATENMSSHTVGYSPMPGHAILAAAYACGLNAISNNCGLNPTTTLTLSDNVHPNGETCFKASPHSPFTLIEGGTRGQHVQEYLWACPNIPSGVTSFTAKCSVAHSCSFIALVVSEWTGLASSNMFDEDGGGASLLHSASLSVSTSAPTHYTYEIIFGFFDNTADEAMTPTSPAKDINQFYSGNITAGYMAATPGVHIVSTKWSTPDNWYGAVAAIKTAESQLSTTVDPPPCLSSTPQATAP